MRPFVPFEGVLEKQIGTLMAARTFITVEPVYLLTSTHSIRLFIRMPQPMLLL